MFVLGIDLVFYVPWKVLCELDTLKSSNRSIARRAQRACSLMSSKCNDSSSRLRAQPPFMHGKVIDGFKPETSDDYILLSALQLKIEGHSVVSNFVFICNDKILLRYRIAFYIFIIIILIVPIRCMMYLVELTIYFWLSSSDRSENLRLFVKDVGRHISIECLRRRRIFREISCKIDKDNTAPVNTGFHYAYC